MKRRVFSFLLVLVLILAAAALPVFARARQILCIGESLTCGSGSTWKTDDPNDKTTVATITKGNTYPGRLDALLGSSWEVYNCGVSGIAVLPEPSWTYAERGYLYCVQEFFADSDSRNPFGEQYAPDDVFVFLGTNDCKPRIWEIATGGSENFYAAYTQIVEELKAIDTHPNVYCIIPPPVMDDDENLTNYTMVEAILRDEISPIIRRVANEQRCRVVDLRSLFENYANGKEALYYPGDGAHPNPDGYDLIAKELVRVLRILPGDVNASGGVNDGDLTLLAKYVSGWNVTVDEEASDVDLNGVVELEDLIRLAKRLSGWDVTFLPAPRDLSD